MSISVVINLDSRPGIDGCAGGTMGDGARSWDFFVDGVKNKRKFFEGRGMLEFVIYIDQHLPVPQKIVESMLGCLEGCEVKTHLFEHREGQKNDENYLAALRLATGDYVAHFDQDVVAFGDPRMWITPLGVYKFVSYPCASSPDPDPDRARWKDFRWASTRAFFCRRKDLRLDDLEHCLQDQEWAYRTFGTPPSCHPWTEHYLGLMAGANQVYYPPLNENFQIWSWSKYLPGVLPALNQMSHEEVRAYVQRCGGINWAGELEAKPI